MLTAKERGRFDTLILIGNTSKPPDSEGTDSVEGRRIGHRRGGTIARSLAALDVSVDTMARTHQQK